MPKELRDDIFVVIMAGGSGTRFWPVSRTRRPKQLVRIVGQDTMIQATVARLQPAIPPERVVIITTAALAEETRKQLPMVKPEHVIAEPVGRDTAPCVALAALLIEKQHPGATMILLPADQTISPADELQKSLLAAAEVAADGSLITFGIEPRFPATGYGYIHVGELLAKQASIPVHTVHRFVEKPDTATASTYLEAGEYLWNSGMFIWRCDAVLAEMRGACPHIIEVLEPVQERWGSEDFAEALAIGYDRVEKISVDYALLEKASEIKVMRVGFQWDDVGSWDALYDHLPVDSDGVIRRGEVLTIGCSDSLLINNSEQLVAGIGVEGLTVVTTPDAVLVCAKGAGQDVKKLVDQLKQGGMSEYCD